MKQPHNLGVALACQGRCKEAAEAYELAASWSTEPAKYLEAAERERRRGEEKELEAKQRAQAEREREDADARAFETERKRQQAFLATAPQRWAQLGYWPRRLLCTLHAIKEFESLDHLVELSGQDGRYVRGHYRKLVESGMITENDSGYIVNEHVVALVEREHSHSVVSSIVRADREIAVKLIFNSRNEYKIYQSLLEIFPNNLVFPNMALQGIFSYDRMKEILDGNCFGYFLRASVDFCVVSTASYFPIVAFEADSYWHESDHQKARDEMKDLIFAAGGMSLIRLRPYGTPSDTAIRGDIIAAVSKWLSGRSETRIGRTGFDPATELDLSQFQTLKVVDERR